MTPDEIREAVDRRLAAALRRLTDVETALEDATTEANRLRRDIQAARDLLAAPSTYEHAKGAVA